VFLPKSIYENLPYIYFLISGALLVLGEEKVLKASAAIFYSAACIVLVTRSAHRRLDTSKGKSAKHQLPEIIYEYLPYCYCAIGIFILMAKPQPIYQFIAFALIIFALRNLVFRNKNRRKRRSLF